MSEKDNENEKEKESECFINIIKFLILGNQEGSVEFCSLLFTHLSTPGSCGDKLGAISALSTLIRVEPFRTVRLPLYRDVDTRYHGALTCAIKKISTAVHSVRWR
jgi:hypothetical protein